MLFFFKEGWLILGVAPAAAVLKNVGEIRPASPHQPTPSPAAFKKHLDPAPPPVSNRPGVRVEQGSRLEERPALFAGCDSSGGIRETRPARAAPV